MSCNPDPVFNFQTWGVGEVNRAYLGAYGSYSSEHNLKFIVISHSFMN
jgi:hypothetical protein